MGRKSTKVNFTQPKRTYTSSSGSSVYQKPSNPTTIPNPNLTTPSTAPNTTGTLGNSLKQGVATGVGFGMANAAMSSIFSNMRGDSQETIPVPATNSFESTKPVNPCESFLNLYTDCLKSQANLMEDNCEYFLANFKQCTSKIQH